MANDNQPIIIKRIKKGGHGHHGGSWKVAFADFVTAMMAFFMLMWLLGSTTPEQKAAISDYFNNPSAVPGPGGASNSMIEHGGEMDIPTGEGMNPMQHNKPGEIETESDDASAGKATLEDITAEELEEMARKKERDEMESLLEDLKKSIEAGQALAPYKDQLLLDITSEGLRIQIVDKENRPMFDSGSANLKSYTQTILREISRVINKSGNRISISGHTDRTPFASTDGYSNWELSADRANAARRTLVEAGLGEAKIGRVVGLSDSVLFDRKNPYNPINRRISIVVMNKDTEKAVSEGEGAAVPEANNTPAPGAAKRPAADETKKKTTKPSAASATRTKNAGNTDA